MLISDDNHVWPGWAPDWLRFQVESPDCSAGTHPALRRLAKWLVVYMPPDECPDLAFYWLRVAADKCDRVPDDAELKRLLTWANARTGNQDGSAGGYSPSQPVIDLDQLYELIIAGPTRDQFRELSPVRLYDTKQRSTPAIFDEWGRYSGTDNPWICYGSKDYFFTRRLGEMRSRAHVFEQIVPSPMRDQYGQTVDGHPSQHSLDGTGPRLFLVTEFDFVPVNNKREPTIWAPLIKRCQDKGRSVLDMNAALAAHLRELAPLWMVVYSGGKSLQSWFPCKDTDDCTLREWYAGEALALGACRSTWCRSQFVRMPDGTRDDGRQQSVEYFDPAVISQNAGGAAYSDGAARSNSHTPPSGENFYANSDK